MLKYQYVGEYAIVDLLTLFNRTFIDRSRYLKLANHKSGGKITASHSTVIDAAVPIVEAAEKMPDVSKISLGIIKQAGKGRTQRRIKFLPITGGWKLTIRGSTSVQEIFIYSGHPDSTKTSLETTFG